MFSWLVGALERSLERPLDFILFIILLTTKRLAYFGPLCVCVLSSLSHATDSRLFVCFHIVTSRREKKKSSMNISSIQRFSLLKVGRAQSLESLHWAAGRRRGAKCLSWPSSVVSRADQTRIQTGLPALPVPCVRTCCLLLLRSFVTKTLEHYSLR